MKGDMHMKRHLFATLTVALLASAASAQNTNILTPTNVPVKTDFSKIFKSEKEKYSYAIGMFWASGVKSKLQSQDLEYDPQAMAKAFTDALMATPGPVITEAQEREILTDLNAQLSAKREEKRKQQADEVRMRGEKALTEGPAFLDKNKTALGVTTLPSGLQYKVLTAGDPNGTTPVNNDEVTVNYRGTLIDGTEFDSSAKHGRAFTTRLPGGVIKGWVEALELMKTGAKWEVFIPSEMAYGKNGSGAQIPPNSVLIFEIELLSVKHADTAAAPAPPTIQPSAPPTPLTSDIIKVPSAEEMKKGAKIETIKAEDLEKEKAKSLPRF
jgi:FKBP-type peptidyl-prolyl cis-trans isomerase FklB